jgi:ferric-dicitrate binding protein FerR (iron transport regulator)
MIDETREDEQLRAQFERLRSVDARSTPAFGPMLEAARAAAVTAGSSAAPAAGTTRRQAPRWYRSPVVVWGGPVLAAAGLGALWVLPDRLAERAFDEAVASYTETTTMRSPTAGLLQVPGTEFLLGLPSVGAKVASPPRGTGRGL